MSVSSTLTTVAQNAVSPSHGRAGLMARRSSVPVSPKKCLYRQIQQIPRPHQLHPAVINEVGRDQRGDDPEHECAKNSVAQRLTLLVPGQPEHENCEYQRVVGTQQPFEQDQQRDGQEIREMNVHSAAVGVDTERIKVYISIDARFGGDANRFHAIGGSSGALRLWQSSLILYFISMAARLLDMHPQTLRKYERLGLVRPTRTVGSMRVYTSDELARLRLIKHLVDDVGVNLAGVQRLLSIAEAVQRLRPLLREDARGDARRRMALEVERISQMVGL